MSDSLKETFWDRLADTRTGMLATKDSRAVPMSHYIGEDSGRNVLWFITANGTDLSRAAATGASAEYLVSSNDESLYARIDGRVTQSDDKAQLDKLWNGVAGAWFEDGKQDSDVQLIRMDLTEAEVWATGGSMHFLYEIAKAHLTDEKPDMGEHGTLRF
ncbi:MULTISPECIES: pyridoxamine 5'-phosphate oxidase family protein [unclassified Sulfitobacter]|uniref:pyridoxamine 5'-phosphate oxidase family protein n=1 Tax=unclassified Sulfitobacter TaxID=196795 RepID=UPI0007C39F56|nr:MULTISPECIES: pyridoxamine 5'-phosphate oxidase family protein [unclassified Sulfitobacter]KZY05710.1 general stress protein [Sulfitobacter sp. HI0023]KZY22293.1 general stress protein [Sulfitobacter sp. HI0040]KZZ70124.1 general stress protein [Sulfitobacter sp. HI0129]